MIFNWISSNSNLNHKISNLKSKIKMMDSNLPEQKDFEANGGNGCEPIESYYIQDDSVKNAVQEQLVFVLAGSVHEINPVRLRIIETHLRKISGYTRITVTDIQAGSIKIKGSLLYLEKLQDLFAEGKLLEVLGIPIQDIYFLSDRTKDNEKSCLVRDILENGAFGKDLTNVDFKRANLAGADLSSSDLNGANLEGTNLEGANLLYVNLLNTTIDAKTKLDDKWLLVWKIVNGLVEKKKLTGADFTFTYLVNADFSGAIVCNANFENANLEGINFSGANLRGVNFSDTNLEGADFSGANLSNANLTNADLSYANLTEADLRCANLINSDLSNANVSNANLCDAILNNANLIRANFSDAQLRGTNLIKTYLSGANLIRADLRRANLKNAHLDAAYLISADLRGANLNNAFLDAANFKGANVENTRFGNNPGISQQIKDDLIRRGAVF